MDTTCTTGDNGSIRCDNGIHCANGGTVGNNFTLSQKGPDEKKFQDRFIVSRKDNVFTGDCGFILQSNGLPNSTRVISSNCRNGTSATTPASSATSSAHTSTYSSSNTTQPTATPSVLVSSAAARQSTFSLRSALLAALIALFCFLIPGAQASAPDPSRGSVVVGNDDFNTTILELNKREDPWLETLDEFKGKLWDYLVDKAVDKAAGESAAKSITDEVMDAACKAMVYKVMNEAGKEAFLKQFLLPCIEVIEGSVLIFQPELEIFAALWADFGCNLIITEIFNRIDVTDTVDFGDVAGLICSGPKPCSEDMMTDSENCGTCGNKASNIILVKYTLDSHRLISPAVLRILRTRRLSEGQLRGRQHQRQPLRNRR